MFTKPLYNGANTAVKANGEIGRAFAQLAGVRQGCPLSPLLYIFVHEVRPPQCSRSAASRMKAGYFVSTWRWRERWPG